MKMIKVQTDTKRYKGKGRDNKGDLPVPPAEMVELENVFNVMRRARKTHKLKKVISPHELF